MLLFLSTVTLFYSVQCVSEKYVNLSFFSHMSSNFDSSWQKRIAKNLKQTHAVYEAQHIPLYMIVLHLAKTSNDFTAYITSINIVCTVILCVAPFLN